MTKRYCRYAIDRGCVPIVPHLYLPSVLSEETERELALRNIPSNINVVNKCSSSFAHKCTNKIPIYRDHITILGTSGKVSLDFSPTPVYACAQGGMPHD